MAIRDSLEISVTSLPTSRTVRAKLLGHLWSCESLKEDKTPRLEPLEAYLEYYASQCDLFSIEQNSCLSKYRDGIKSIATHQDVVDVAQLAGEQLDRSELMDRLRSNRIPVQPGVANQSFVAEDKALNTMINWCARLVTMTEIGKIQFAFSSRRPLLWNDGTLQDFMSKVFVPEKPCTTQAKLERSFTLHNMERLTGLNIEWTDDLASHLSLRDDDRKLLVFHHATFLASSRVTVFPRGLLDETLRTLALLLPSQDQSSKKWYRKQQKKRNLDPNAVECPRLRADDRQIENFHYWRERLCILKQLYDEAEPSTLTQWWFDRRKGPQWYTFWVAVAVLVLTIFFGVIQSIEGALQAYKAWYPK